MHVNHLSYNKATHSCFRISHFISLLGSFRRFQEDIARESELKRCRFGQVSIDFESEI